MKLKLSFLCILTLTLFFNIYGISRISKPDSNLFPIKGIDVSHHQGNIDWLKLKEDEISFAYIKASEGKDFSDSKFDYNWEASKKANIPRGAYHFFTFCSSGEAQAKHFLKTVTPSITSLPPAIDVEFVGNCESFKSLKSIRNELKIFTELIEKAWKRRPIFYVTNRSNKIILKDNYNDYPKWFRSIGRMPNLKNWYIWQYSSTGKISACDKTVDQNVLQNGISLKDLSILLK